MSGVNKVILVGHLGRDPELRTVGSGQKCQFTLATSRSWRDKQGNPQEKTEWHRIIVWGNLAGTVSQYAKKGRQVYVEGSIESREFENNGEKQRTFEINARTVEFLGSRDDAGSGGGQRGYSSQQPVQYGGRNDHSYDMPGGGSADDVPF